MNETERPSAAQLWASTPNCLAYEAGAEALPLWEEIWPGPAMKLVGPLAAGCPILNFAFFAKFRVGIFAGASACFCP